MEIFSRVENFISKKSDSNTLIAIFGILYFASQIKIASIVHPLGIDMWRIQTTLSSDTFKSIASGWIASGQVNIYYRHFYFDNFHPVWYSIFLSLLIARIFKINNVHSKFNFIILTPFVAAICDFFENTMHLYFLADLNRTTPLLVALSGLATNTKWVLAFLDVGIISVLVSVWFVKTFITEKK
ncbi:MAG: hypothetical protein WC373_01305 [Smithella sp.]